MKMSEKLKNKRLRFKNMIKKNISLYNNYDNDSY